ncbi:MAG: type II toxin-antitoxin system HicA family toxin [Bacteroidales bacterium]|jgi:predicted RNA binding protein YcfA (HicA-like mRNA interferase family)|nr:type II toxin-antitoxin system HicA family toxin [Bacteroidales bacterium]
MSKQDKAIKRIINNPKNVTFDDLDKIMKGLGYVRRNNGSSHYIYTLPGCYPITIPKHKPVKEIYVKKVIELLDLEGYK